MNIIKKFVYALPAVAMLGLGSCTSYLDKSPDSDVSAEDAFSNFRNFQGFVEEEYGKVPSMSNGNWNMSFNYGEDEILSTGGNSPYVTSYFDRGDFRSYYQNWGGGFTIMFKTGGHHKGLENGVLNNGWKMIRKANVGIENFGLLTEATEAQKKAIWGQLHFWRAWWHMMMLEYMGGVPYIDKVPDANAILNDPRLSALETALKCAEDFQVAADNLPNDWDRSDAGDATSGHNELRITRATALAYLGRMYLYAASPLAQFGPMTGAGDKTYQYDQDLAKKAAEALGTCISEIESGITPYQLASYEYSDIYEHEAKEGVTNIYSEIFFTHGLNWLQPGGKEAMMRGSREGTNLARWGNGTNWGPNVNNACDGSFTITPTANYVNYAYGMADGTRFEDALKEDPNVAKFPFKNRDKRFYHDICYDGCRFINAPTDKFADMVYYSLYTGGLMRDVQLASRTGFFCQKFYPHTCNSSDGGYDYDPQPQCYIPWLRVAEVYLLYAEAGAAISGPTYRASTCSKTAVDAINVLRDRVGVAHVLGKYQVDQKTFMDEVRRERACELAFEGQRMKDLMRWLQLTEKPWNIKTSIEFTRKNPNYDYENNAPEDAEVVNYHEELILERALTAKHYFWPWRDEDTYIYKDFQQNPGW